MNHTGSHPHCDEPAQSAVRRFSGSRQACPGGGELAADDRPRRDETGVMNQSSFAPESLMTFAHFFVSARM
jgi:hypothetical protein